MYDLEDLATWQERFFVLVILAFSFLVVITFRVLCRSAGKWQIKFEG